MKIAILDMDDLRNPFWGAGAARATREVGKRLAKKNEVTVYCSKYPGYSDYIEDGVKYIHKGINFPNAKLTNLIFIASMPFLVRKMNADLIIENFHAPTSVSFSPIFTKIPVIALPAMFNAREFAKKYHFPFHWIEKFGMKFYKYMLPYSQTDSAKAKKLNPKIIYKIVPQGVGEEFFKIQHKNPEHILFLSRFDIEQKGIDLLLHSYAKITDKIGYPLVIAGHGSDEGKMNKLIEELNIKEKVRIVGSAYGEKKKKLIQKALFVAFPSKHDEISLWTLEALASGLPVVAFDLPESKWIDKDVALKAKPFDLDDYAGKLLEAGKPGLNKKMRKNAREFAKKFTWDKVAEQFDEFFKYVLEREKVNE